MARALEFMKQNLPNIGTILFQSAIGQTTTVLLGRLGELPIAASSALSTVTIPWSGTISSTTGTVSGVEVGYHLGKGDANGAWQSVVAIFLGSDWDKCVEDPREKSFCTST